mmetsp:Transcript_93800/g.279961  ORF Transcript_93800/g.279961 Transcript_93800/m.279961 type:complete len:241 (-) Transcript_93800:413-1135(-)
MRDVQLARWSGLPSLRWPTPRLPREPLANPRLHLPPLARLPSRNPPRTLQPQHTSNRRPPAASRWLHPRLLQVPPRASSPRRRRSRRRRRRRHQPAPAGGARRALRLRPPPPAQLPSRSHPRLPSPQRTSDRRPPVASRRLQAASRAQSRCRRSRRRHIHRRRSRRRSRQRSRCLPDPVTGTRRTACRGCRTTPCGSPSPGWGPCSRWACACASLAGPSAARSTGTSSSRRPTTRACRPR